MVASKKQKLEEKGFRFATSREADVYFGRLMTGVHKQLISPKEKEDAIKAIGEIRKELSLAITDNIVPIDFVVPGDEKQ